MGLQLERSAERDLGPRHVAENRGFDPGTVEARLGSSAVVITEDDVLVQAKATNIGLAEGHGVTVAGIAVGGMVVSVNIGADPDVGPAIDEVVASLDSGAEIRDARFVTVKAISDSTAIAQGESAGGGLISVTGADVSTKSDQTAKVNIGAGAMITAESVNLESTNTHNQDTRSDALSIGLATGGGALASNTVTGDSFIDIGANAEITAINIAVSAKNVFIKDHFFNLDIINLKSATAAVGSISVLLSDTDVGSDGNPFDARITVGDHAKLLSVGNNADPGLLRLEAFTDVFALDNVEVEAYGIVGVTLGSSDIEIDSKSSVDVQGGTIKSNAGDVNITTRTNGYARTDTNATIAVALTGAGGSNSYTDIDTSNDIILNNATVKGSDVYLYAGRDAGGQVNISDGYANSNVQAYSLLPSLGVPIANVTLAEHNNISVQGLSNITSLQNITMRTIEGIGGNERGHESGDVLSLSLLPYGVSVDDNANTSSTNTVTVGSWARVEAGVNNQSLMYVEPLTLSGSSIVSNTR